MTKYKITDIKPDTRFKSDVMLDQLFLLATPPCALTSETLSFLKTWGLYEVFSEDERVIPKPEETSSPEKDNSRPKTAIGKTEEVDLSQFTTDEEISKPKEEIPEKFKTSEEVDLSQFADFSEEPPKNVVQQPQPVEPVTPKISPVTPSKPTEESSVSKEEDKKKIAEAQKVYDEFMDFITAVYTKYATQKEIVLPELNEKILKLCNFVRENKEAIMRISPDIDVRNKRFLINHALRSAIIAIIIGTQIKLSHEKLIELGVTCILHEIGQIQLPPYIYMSEKALSTSERARMQTHTVIGYNIMKRAELPLAIQLGVLEHHERENGSGYPRHLLGSNISLYGKIIGVACSFEAITTPRHYKEAKTSHEGIVEILRNNKSLYDTSIVKALLCSIALFPIGAFVFLSNGRVAQVVDTSLTDPTHPIVQIIGGINTDGTVKRIKIDDKVKISRQMTQEESEDLRQAMGEEIY